MVENRFEARGSRPSVWIAAAVLMLALAGLLLIAIVQATQVDRVSFLNGIGEPSLTRTHARVGEVIRFETWQQPTSFSYSLWIPFQADDPLGFELQCQLALEGWLRTDSRHRNLADLSCRCENPKRHHNREVACMDLLR